MALILAPGGLLTAGAAAAVAPGPVVAVDVGHTPQAPGATSARGVKEYDLNRQLAKVVVHRIRAVGLGAFLVNGDGRIGGLTDRTAAATRRGARFFLSIHHDSVQPQFLQSWRVDGVDRMRSEGRRGFSLFVSNRNPDLAGSLRCASAIGEALRTAGFTPSRYHAEPIVGEDRPFADEINGVHLYNGLAVLRSSSTAAVLLEAGVISDADEELVLERPATREAIGQAVAAGLRGCLNEAAPVGDPAPGSDAAP